MSKDSLPSRRTKISGIYLEVMQDGIADLAL